jgi:twitching motility protein PilI
VVDLAGFLGVKVNEAQPHQQAQYVGFNQSLDLNCVLLVDRLAGLRGAEQLTRDSDDKTPRPAFAGATYHDAAGRPWQELSLAALAGDEAFLRIVG